MVRRSPRNRPAFSLVEMLIVIGILIVLLALLVPAMNRAREASRRAACASNLRQIGAAMMKYATENNGKLPQHAGASPFWLFDIPKPTRDALLKMGAERGVFYCPSNEFVQNADGLWNYPSGKPDESSFHCATGYQFLMRRPTAVNMPPLEFQRKFLTSINDSITLVYPAPRNTVVRTSSADIEMVTDMVNSKGTGTSENFFGTRGGFKDAHPTSHMTKNKPSGGNVLFLDGHVIWRNFSEMEVQHKHPDGNKFYF
jgi:prepilin-type processing-associated H-X9-DG protein